MGPLVALQSKATANSSTRLDMNSVQAKPRLSSGQGLGADNTINT